jgi:hypothetical protein
MATKENSTGNLTIEYDGNLDIVAVTLPDGRRVAEGEELKNYPIVDVTVRMVTVTEILELTDSKGVARLCVHHRCRKYC